jgi:hypothetical protein
MAWYGLTTDFHGKMQWKLKFSETAG